jgi:hypothetical protein
VKTDGLMNDDWHNKSLWIWSDSCVMVLPFSVGSPFFVVAAFPMARLVFFFFSSLGFSHAHIRTTSKHSRTANAAGISLLTKQNQKVVAVYDIWSQPTKSGSNVSGNAVGLMTSTTDFVWQPNYAYKLSICCLFGSRFYVSGTLVTPAQSITQVAMQCNTMERSCCTSWVVPQTFDQCHKKWRKKFRKKNPPKRVENGCCSSSLNVSYRFCTYCFDALERSPKWRMGNSQATESLLGGGSAQSDVARFW